MSRSSKHYCHCCGKEMPLDAYSEWNSAWRLMPGYLTMENGRDVECPNCQSDPHSHDPNQAAVEVAA